jgi:hypothetical protein
MQTYEPPIQMFIKPFHNFIFMNVKVEKNLSSSIDPIIWTITNYAIFMNIESQAQNNASILTTQFGNNNFNYIIDDGENGYFVSDKK